MAYTITGEKCGTVRLDAEKTGVVVTESVQRSSKVTSNPVEKGSDINDHVSAEIASILSKLLDFIFRWKECGKKKMWLSIPGAPGSLTAL